MYVCLMDKVKREMMRSIVLVSYKGDGFKLVVRKVITYCFDIVRHCLSLSD